MDAWVMYAGMPLGTRLVLCSGFRQLKNGREAVRDRFLDREGEMARYLEAAIARGAVERENVLMYEGSFEEANASSAELIELARDIADNSPPAVPPAQLHLDAANLDAAHADRLAPVPRGDRPGLADTLLLLAAREEHGSVRLDKLALAEALARKLVDDATASRPPSKAPPRGRRSSPAGRLFGSLLSA